MLPLILFAAASADPLVIEEVVGTALKRETTLADRGIDNVSDLLRATPGLSVLDQGAGRAVAYHGECGGYIDNQRLGIEDINEEEANGGRLLLRYSPSDTLTVDLAAHIQREDSAWDSRCAGKCDATLNSAGSASGFAGSFRERCRRVSIIPCRNAPGR